MDLSGSLSQWFYQAVTSAPSFAQLTGGLIFATAVGGLGTYLALKAKEKNLLSGNRAANEFIPTETLIEPSGVLGDDGREILHWSLNSTGIEKFSDILGGSIDDAMMDVISFARKWCLDHGNPLLDEGIKRYKRGLYFEGVERDISSKALDALKALNKAGTRYVNSQYPPPAPVGSSLMRDGVNQQGENVDRTVAVPLVVYPVFVVEPGETNITNLFIIPKHWLKPGFFKSRDIYHWKRGGEVLSPDSGHKQHGRIDTCMKVVNYLRSNPDIADYKSTNLYCHAQFGQVPVPARPEVL